MRVVQSISTVTFETELTEYRIATRGFKRYLEALGRSPATVETYLAATEGFGRFLAAQGRTVTLTSIKKTDIEDWMVELLSHQTKGASGTALTRYKSLQQFFKWACGRGEQLTIDPMARMKQPHVSDNPPAVIGLDKMRALLADCEGKGFTARRDKALILMLIDLGLRRAEVSNLTLEDVDLDRYLVTVLGKGGRPRTVRLGAKSGEALEKYLRLARPGHAAAKRSDQLWLGTRGPLTDSGVYLILQRRAARVGIDHIYPHQFRHTWAHEWLRNGNSENDLMHNAGWGSRQMVARYGRSAAAERAREAQAKHSLGDRL